jgi:predicted DNA-binding protein (UPF0251 family)
MLLNLTEDKNRFWSKVNKHSGVFGADGKFPTECWEWTAAKNNWGYGVFGLNKTKKSVRPHRISWELYYGVIPDDLFVLHKCDNPCCLNPEHLFLGTQADNMRDMSSKGRAKNGGFRPVGEKNGMVKLTDNQAQEIRRLYKEGMPQKDIGKRFGVSQPTVSVIVCRKRWK